MTGLTDQILRQLTTSGLLLKQDKRLPNVVTLVTGETLRTSWWSHPKGRLIFAVLTELAYHPDVLFTKLLLGKDTLVHRRLWPALLAVASAGEPWQVTGLSEAGLNLLADISTSKEPVRSSGQLAKELELRLLAHAEEVHTESGRHETAFEPWESWRRRVKIKPLRTEALGRQQIEEAAFAIGASVPALPWTRSRG